MVSLSHMWIQFNIYIAIAIFFAYVIIDILYVYYTLYVTHLRPIAAANTSFLIYLIAAVGVINYVDNYLYIIPIVVGAWIGTYMTVYWEKRKDGIGNRHRKLGI